LKSYRSPFCDILVHIHQPNEEMFVDVFIKGLRANPFNESLIQNKVKSMTENWKSHIEVEEDLRWKKLKEKWWHA